MNEQAIGFVVSLVAIFSNMAGYTHRSMACAAIFTAYRWGNFAGPFKVKANQAPTYSGATVGLLVGFSIKLGCHLLLLSNYIVSRNNDLMSGQIILLQM